MAALTHLQRAAVAFLATAACLALALVPVARVSKQVTHRQQEPRAAKAFLSRKTLAPQGHQELVAARQELLAI